MKKKWIVTVAGVLLAGLVAGCGNESEDFELTVVETVQTEQGSEADKQETVAAQKSQEQITKETVSEEQTKDGTPGQTKEAEEETAEAVVAVEYMGYEEKMTIEDLMDWWSLEDAKVAEIVVNLSNALTLQQLYEYYANNWSVLDASSKQACNFFYSAGVIDDKVLYGMGIPQGSIQDYFGDADADSDWAWQEDGDSDGNEEGDMDAEMDSDINAEADAEVEVDVDAASAAQNMGW